MTAPSSKKPRLEQSPPFDGAKPIQLQRRRVWRACEPCRRKKTKCSGTMPVCPQCAATSSQCTWIETKDRAALSRHYVQELEARLLYMEQLFKQHAPHIDVFPPEGSGLPPEFIKSVPNLLQTVASTSKGPNEGKDGQTDLDDLNANKEGENDSNLAEGFGQMTLDPEGQIRWIGGSSTMTLIETFRNETASPEGSSPLSDNSIHAAATANTLYFPTDLGKLQALPYAEEVEYPERDLADMLVHAYFERFHFLLPVLDKPSFLERYNLLMNNDGRGQSPGFVAVVFAVFACAARFVNDSRIRSEGGGTDGRGTAMVFYERSMMLYYISATASQLAHVQAFALLSSFLASLNRLPQAWLLVGQAIRTAQDLGLHRSPRPLQLTRVEKETRRKVWWCVYGLDRMLAVQLGRPLGIDDQDIDVDLPLPIDDDDLSAYYEGRYVEAPGATLMQGFVALTRLYRIAGKVLRHVYSTTKHQETPDKERAQELQGVVEKLDSQLMKWFNDLPSGFKNAPTTSQLSTMTAVLSASYESVRIALHRHLLPTKRVSSSSIGASSLPKAVAASRSCIALGGMKPNIPPSHHLAMFVQCLLSSALIILLVVMHATDKTAAVIAMEEVEKCRLVLESLEQHWPGTKRCKELLMEVTEITRESLNKVGKQTIRPKHNFVPATPTVASSSGALKNTTASSSGTGSRHSQSPSGSFNLNLSPAHLTPSPPVTHQLPLKRRREETPEIQSNDKSPSHSGHRSTSSTSRQSNMNNLQSIAMSNVSAGHLTPFLGSNPSLNPPISQSYPTHQNTNWQPRHGASLSIDVDPPFGYGAGLTHGLTTPRESQGPSINHPVPGSIYASTLAQMGGVPSNISTMAYSNGPFSFISNNVGSSDMFAMPPFAGMEVVDNIENAPFATLDDSTMMGFWSNLPPDTFNNDPRTPFGIIDENGPHTT